MANIDNAFTIETLSLSDNVLIADGAFDPSAGAGYEAPVGSMFLRSDTGALYQKTGINDTDWALNSVGTTVPRNQVVYVGKHGSASPAGNGRVPEYPYLTFTQAITYINTQSPSNSNRFQIICDDAGEYTESFTVPTYVLVFGQAARIIGNITLSDFSELNVFSVEASSGSAITKSSGTSVSRVDVDTLVSTGSANTVHNTAGSTGVIICKARQVYTENGAAFLDESNAPGHIHIDIEDIYITGTGSGLDRSSGTGLIVGKASHILETGSGIGNGTGIDINAGRVNATIGYISTATAYNVSGSGTLKLFAAELTGSRIQTSGSAVVDVIESNVLRWLSITTADSPYLAHRIGFISVDTSGGPVTLRLPYPPSAGDNISFQDARNNFETNNLTIDGNGTQIDINGGVNTVTLDISGTAGILVFNAIINRWTFSRIQEQVAFSPSNVIYVTKNGDDAVGDGSFSNPFLTVKKGVTEALVRVAATPVPTTVRILNGTYDEINPIVVTGTNSEYIHLEGDHEFSTIIRPTVNNQPLFSLTSNVATSGPGLYQLTLTASNLPAFKTNGQSLVVTTGPGRFVLDKTNLFSAGIGYNTGNGVSTNQESVFDFATIADCTVGVDAKGNGLQALQVAFVRNCSTGIRCSGAVRLEIGNYTVQGSDIGQPPAGIGIDLNDTATFVGTSGTIVNNTTGVVSNDTSEIQLFATIFDNNMIDFNQVDGTATVVINGRLNKAKQLITNGTTVSLSYTDEATRDFIVGNADATGDPGKEFRVRDFDGRVAIGDNATNANIASGGVGSSRSFNLIDTNGNVRIWRFTAADGEDPALEFLKGMNPANPDGFGDAPILSITAATNTIVVDVSGTDFADGLAGGIDRTTLATRAFPAGRIFRVNGTASNNADLTVASATYNSGPQTISVVTAQDITASEGAGGTIVFGGGAGRTDGVTTYVGDPGAAVAAGAGNVWWDMFLQEDDYFVIRRRTGGAGDLVNEKVRIYPNRSEWLGSTTYNDADSALIFAAQTVTGAVNSLQITNAGTTTGPILSALGTDTNISINLTPKGTGTILVPAGYDANVTSNSLITKSYADALVVNTTQLYTENPVGVVTQTATGTNSIALGDGAAATLYGAKTIANGSFATVGDAQTSILVARRTTTTNVATELFLDGNTATQSMILSNDTSWAFRIHVIARRTDVDNQSASYQFLGTIDRNATAGSTALVGAVSKTVVAEDVGAWNCNVNANATNGSLRILATGATGSTIRWVARVELVEVTG